MDRSDGDTRARCGHCDAALVGRYCHDCGDDSRPPARRLRDIADDVLDNVFDFTAAVPRTLKALFTRPSLVPRALRAGDRSAFLSPMKLYLSASVVFFLVIAALNVSIVQWEVRPSGSGPLRIIVENGELRRIDNFRMVDVWLRPRMADARNPEVIAAFDRAIPTVTDDVERAILLGMRGVAADPARLNDLIETWAPRLLWLLMPISALLLWPLYARGRLLSEHVIFTLWAHAMLFLLLVLGALWNLLGVGLGLTAALLAYQVYLTLGLKGYYEGSWAGAVTKGLAHSAVYVGLIWFPLAVGVLMFAQAAQHLPADYWTR